MLLRWALRELIQNWKTSLVFILNLSLGLIGFVTLDAFNGSLTKYLESNAKKILSADVAVSSRRPISDEEIKRTREIIGEPLKESQLFEFFAMMSAGEQSRLVSIKAIDENYPFYGEIQLQNGARISGATPKVIVTEKRAWLFPELQHQMNLKVGDNLQLGQLQLKVDDFIFKDDTQTFRSASVAPRVYISRYFLKESGLIQFGSTFSHTYLYKLNNDDLIEPKRQALEKVLQDPAIDIETPKTAGEDSGRQLKYLSDYLGLVSLVAIFLSSLGAAYVYRLFLSQRFKEIAIYRSLGLQSHEAVGVYVLQATLLGALALIPTLGLSRIFLPLLSYVLNQLVPFELQPEITLNSVIFSFVFAVFISFLVTLPFILRIHGLKASRLFNEEKFSEVLTLKHPWAFLPAVVAMWALSVWQSHSLRTGSIFFFSLLGILFIFFIAGWFLFGLFNKNNSETWYLKYGLISLARLRAGSVAAFIALGVGALLINILPQIKTSIQAEFYVNPNSKMPSLFMFDIQDEQIGSLEQTLRQENVNLVLKSPLVRARILSINGQPYERPISPDDTFKTREEERDARFRNRGVNLSYREKLADSETIIEGPPLVCCYTNSMNRLPGLSIEDGYRERMGIKLNDNIKFDVQGVEFEGRVVNFRKVKWNSFQPNFFILVEPGVLDEAPKTFIAAVPKLPEEKKNHLQNIVAKNFPNVSIIDVERTVTEILKVAEQMSWSLELMAGLALLVGYVVLYSIIRNQVLQRRWELNMLKVLGSTFTEIRLYVLIESVAIAVSAALLGTLLSIGISFILANWVFKTVFVMDFLTPSVSILVVTSLAVIVALLAAQRVLKEKPLVILRENT
jgi:putative ABC transport system permease protein